MDFGLSTEQQMVVETVRGFVERELYPLEAEVERTGEVPDEGDAEPAADEPADEPAEGEGDDRSAMRYRLQRRGGKGLKDVRVTDKNGKVVGIAAVRTGDEVMFTTLQGMVTRSRTDDVRLVGRNTQGVRLITLESTTEKVTGISQLPEIAEAEGEGGEGLGGAGAIEGGAGVETSASSESGSESSGEGEGGSEPTGE